MSERPLLLSSAKSGILIPHRAAPSVWWRRGAIVFGIVAIIVGAADITTRLSQFAFGGDAAFVAFAPAAALEQASLSQALTGNFAATSSISFVPTHLRIPSIGVNASVEKVGKKADGSMGTPSTFYTVGWYSPGPKPGEAGNAVIDGHVNNALGLSGVFEHLGDVHIGDTVEVLGANEEILTYMVTSSQEYATDEAPLESIFATSGPSQLVLITCDGEWVSADHSYNKRLVVTARLVH